MAVFLHNSPFAATEAYVVPSIALRLSDPTSDTAELIAHATGALERIYRPGPHYAKCGAMLAELAPEATAPADLFDRRDRDRRRRLMETLDAVNRRMGRDTVTFASSGLRRDWQASAAMQSPHFTTELSDVIHVRA